jgi:hypothetical protein
VLGEDLDSVSLACRLLDTQEHLGKVALSKFLQESILLLENASVPCPGVSEDESGFVKYRNFIMFLELPALVSPDQSFVDKGAIAREILENSYGIVAFVLRE